jgi:hypothetical protein
MHLMALLVQVEIASQHVANIAASGVVIASGAECPRVSLDDARVF